MAPLSRDADGHGPLRLLWLIDSLQMGGAERLAATFARALDPRAMSLHVCALKRIAGNPVEEELAAAGIAVTTLHARNLRDVRAFARLVRLMRDGRFQVVHAHLTDASIWGSLAGWRTGVPVVASLHVMPGASRRLSRPALRERLMCAALNRLSATTIAVSAALRDAYVQRGLLDPARVTVVHNGIDVSRFAPADQEGRQAARQALGIADDAPLLVTTSVLRDRRKGVHVLLRALPRILGVHSAARLLVIGDGPIRPALEADAARLGIAGAIHWAGHRDDVASLLAAGDLFVLPTLEEPFPTAVLEAMATGLPVVASDIGGIPEMLDAPALGRLVTPGDADALARAVTGLLGDPRGRRAAAEMARRRACDRFSDRAWTERLTRVYMAAIERADTVPAPAGTGRVEAS